MSVKNLRQKKIRIEQEMMLKVKKQEYKDEIEIEKDRKQFLQNFLRQEQAVIRKNMLKDKESS